MRKNLICLVLIFLSFQFNQKEMNAQGPLKAPPLGGSQKAQIIQYIGVTEISIRYHRPGVRGRNGKIWGKLVPWGFTTAPFDTKLIPWRAGANETTIISFSDDVTVEGKNLPAAAYGLFMAVWPDSCILIFSKISRSWGSFAYNDKDDVLRVVVKPAKLEKSEEWLKYDFLNPSENSVTVALSWEKLMIPFRVETDLQKNVIKSFRQQLKMPQMASNPAAWQQAAAYCSENKMNLEEALIWSDSAIAHIPAGKRNFGIMATKANVLSRLGRINEADAIVKDAMPVAEIYELYNYGMSLLEANRKEKAFEIFEFAYKQVGDDDWLACVGLGEGYFALNNPAKALEYAEKALKASPDGNKQLAENLIKKITNKK